ncbi:MAG: hypothetical protein ACRD1R_11345 [Acidobacteriota bacterium]
MESRSRATLSELKVGIFVVITVLILAVAIFTIGAQVGIFEDTFTAKTYLNNVSGLKPGDIVLLGGVEVGNVKEVEIQSDPDFLPPTPANQANLRLISQLTIEAAQLQERLNTSELELAELETNYQSSAGVLGADAPQVLALQEQLAEGEGQVEDLREDLEELQDDIQNVHASLQNIEVYMEITSQYRNWIKNDSSISLGSVGLLGDKYIEISLGRTDIPPPVIREERDAWIGTEEREVVVVTGTGQAGFQELITGANDILANLETLSDKLTEIMDTFQEGEGSIGKFFSDPAFYNNLNAAVLGARQTVEQASDMMQDVTQGQGTVPRLIQDREVYDNIRTATMRLEQVLTGVEQGQGTVGQLIRDPRLYQSSERAMSNVRTITDRIQSGQGTLGQLVTNDKVYRDLDSSLERMAAFLTDLEQGEGTLGMLAKDESLYRNVNELSSEVVKLLYDFRQNPKKFLTIKFELF